MAKLGRGAGLCLLAAVATAAWPAEYYSRLGGGLGYEDNTTGGADKRFRRGDFVYRLNAAAGLNHALGDSSGLTGEARIEAAQWQRFERLSSLRGALLGRALFKPFDGYAAPWLALESEAAVVGHKDSSLRDRWEWYGRALAGARLAERLSASLGYEFSLSRGAQWQVWNTQAHTLLFGAEYELAPWFSLFCDYRLGVGKFNSAALWERPGSPLPAYYDVRWRDKALEADAAGKVYAYRMDGVLQQVAVGGAWSLQAWQFRLSGHYRALQGEAGAFYQGLGAELGVQYPF